MRRILPIILLSFIAIKPAMELQSADEAAEAAPVDPTVLENQQQKKALVDYYQTVFSKGKNVISQIPPVILRMVADYAPYKWKDFPGVSMIADPDVKGPIAVSPDGQYLASAGEYDSDGARLNSTPVKILKTFEWEQAHTLPGESDMFNPSFSPMIDHDRRKGYYLAASSIESVMVFKSGTWDLAHRFDEKRLGDLIWCRAFSADGQQLALGVRHKGVQMWDMRSGELNRTLPGTKEQTISQIHFSPTSPYLASVELGKKDIKIWDTNTDALLKTVDGAVRRIDSFSFSPDGRHLAVCADGSDSVFLYDITTAEKDIGKNISGLLSGRSRWYVDKAIFAPEGNCVALSQGPLISLLYKNRKNKWQHAYDIEKGSILGDIAFSPDHHYLATTSSTRGLTIWNLRLIERRLARADALMGSLLHELQGDNKVIEGMLRSPDAVQLLRDFLIEAQMRMHSSLPEEDPSERWDRFPLDIRETSEYKFAVSTIITNNLLGSFLDKGPITARLEKAGLTLPGERKKGYELSKMKGELSKMKNAGSRIFSERFEKAKKAPISSRLRDQRVQEQIKSDGALRRLWRLAGIQSSAPKAAVRPDPIEEKNPTD